MNRISPLAASQRSLRKSLGQFDQDASIGWILDVFKRDDEAQPLNDGQIDLIVLKQLQQFIIGMIGIVRAHSQSSTSE
jgi:hypothetical protein